MTFEAYTGHVGLGRQMEDAAANQGTLALATFGPQSTEVARALYVSKRDGKALGLALPPPPA